MSSPREHSLPSKATDLRPTTDDIRRCRQELLSSRLEGVTKAGDFFSTSECRDLLFHFQMSDDHSTDQILPR
jgi:hypothetical protein